jgi:predicted esterase
LTLAVSASLLLASGAQAATPPVRVAVAKVSRDSLVQRGLLPLRVRLARSGTVHLGVRLEGLKGRSTAVGRTIRFRRAGTRTIRLRLTRPARTSLGRCRPATLRISARRGKLRPATAFLKLAACEKSVHRVDGATGDWVGTPTFISGTSTLSRGELIYTDYLYDDYGPNADGAPGMPAFRSNLAPVKGDFRYPADAARYGDNAADLRELRVAAASDGGLRLLIGMQTMKVADAAIVTLAIDTDGDAGTSAPWPEGVGLAPAGADRYVTTWGSGARLDGAPGGPRTLESAVDLAENAIEVAVPADALAGAGAKARMWIVSGLHAGAGKWAVQQDGKTAVFNAGFRREEYPRLTGSAWSEELQAAALAAGDVSAFSLGLPLARLRAGESDPPPVLAPGYYNRIFRSQNALGEGVAADANGGDQGSQVGGGEAPTFLSDWQPYGLYIPKGYREGTKAQLLLAGHSLDSNLNQYEYVAPHSLQQLGDERNSIMFTPLARGTDTWYLDAGLVDVLEAWEDVRRNYSVDHERTSIFGYSMGGYMTYRLGLLMPDRFARASVYVGPPAYSLWPYPLPIQSTPKWLVPGNTNQIVANAHDLPYEVVHGNADELVPVNGVQHQVDTFMAAGNAVRFYRHSADDHLSFTLYDEWARTRDWLGSFSRERNPVQVVYKRMPSMDLPKHGLMFDGAYWVDGIDVRDTSAPDAAGTVDVTTHGLGGTRRALENPPPTPVTGPTTPGTMTEQKVVAGAAIARENGAELVLRNVSRLTLDLDRMGLDPTQPIHLTVDSDGPVTVLLGKRPVDFPTGKSDRKI